MWTAEKQFHCTEKCFYFANTTINALNLETKQTRVVVYIYHTYWKKIHLLIYPPLNPNLAKWLCTNYFLWQLYMRYTNLTSPKYCIFCYLGTNFQTVAYSMLAWGRVCLSYTTLSVVLLLWGKFCPLYNLASIIWSLVQTQHFNWVEVWNLTLPLHLEFVFGPAALL